MNVHVDDDNNDAGNEGEGVDWSDELKMRNEGTIAKSKDAMDGRWAGVSVSAGDLHALKVIRRSPFPRAS